MLYAYPDGITDGLIELIRDEPKICKYLDIPIQHISDPVLKRMKRRSIEQQIRNLISRLRSGCRISPCAHLPLLASRAETVEDFSSLMHFVEQASSTAWGYFATPGKRDSCGRDAGSGVGTHQA